MVVRPSHVGGETLPSFPSPPRNNSSGLIEGGREGDVGVLPPYQASPPRQSQGSSDRSRYNYQSVKNYKPTCQDEDKTLLSRH